jgi:hypothetical protein
MYNKLILLSSIFIYFNVRGIVIFDIARKSLNLLNIKKLNLR